MDNKVLIISSGLYYTERKVLPFVKNLKNCLSSSCEFLDVRSAMNIMPSTIVQYDTLIFVYPTGMLNVPTPLLSLLKKFDEVEGKKCDVYVMAFTDLYEPNSLVASVKVIERWCKKNALAFKGSLRIGSFDLVKEPTFRLRIIAYIKRLSKKVIVHDRFDEEVTVASLSHFMKHANKYMANTMKNLSKVSKKIQK